jgi:hypothetical protein
MFLSIWMNRSKAVRREKQLPKLVSGVRFPSLALGNPFPRSLDRCRGILRRSLCMGQASMDCPPARQGTTVRKGTRAGMSGTRSKVQHSAIRKVSAFGHHEKDRRGLVDGLATHQPEPQSHTLFIPHHYARGRECGNHFRQST